MKGGGKRKSIATATTSEAPNDAPPPSLPSAAAGFAVPETAAAAAADQVDAGVVPAEGNNGNGAVGVDVAVSGGGGDLVAPLPPVGESENPGRGQGGEGTRVEDSEEDDDDEDEEMEDAGAGAGVDEAGPSDRGRSSLGDGFFEVEAIRRKKVHKGQALYLIKWLGWPDTDNTWEPLENLVNVPEVVAAFEESWKTSKQRKRRRKNVVHHSQLKKRLERSVTPYSLRRFQAATVTNNAQPTPPSTDLHYADIPAFPQPVIFADEVENNGAASKENRLPNASQQVEANAETEYDPKLSELRASTSNGHDADRLAIQFQEANLASGDGHVDGQTNGAFQEPAQGDRFRGARKRKSGSVKRFNKDLFTGEPSHTQNPVGTSDAAAEPGRRGTADNVGNNSQRTNNAQPPHIIRILRPINCSPPFPSLTPDVVVTFIALRSDGAEVMVDNQFLRRNYPALLIDFYEQHLRYCPSA